MCWLRWSFNMYITCGPSAVDPLSILLFTCWSDRWRPSMSISFGFLKYIHLQWHQFTIAENDWWFIGFWHRVNCISYHRKTLGKGMGLRVTLQLMQDKDDILFRVGGQRQSIMNNWWIWPYVLNHTRPIYELSLDCSPTTIERPVGETRGW